MKVLQQTRIYLLVALAALVSCTAVDLYEKSVTIPGHSWEKSFKPSFTFTIKDTTSLYQPYLVLRHTEKYNYNNIYINFYVQGPGQDTAMKFQQNLELANNEEGWKGTGMDDIYEHRIVLGRPESLKAGDYTFTVEQIMRDNPLPHVLNVGIRIEKKP
ncbi:MAG: gliding motility lipoprotein GldH [Chitinophagaceae bacterium]|nr:gliding motility lipoprotein GldH [Chitinophagaceae bacterium]